MADRKITELSAMSAGGQATGDLLTIVDVSESAAADKNKKITVESLFQGIPGNVGIGTASPAHAVHIAGATTPELIVEDTTNNVKAVVGADNSVGRIGTDTNHDLTLRTNDTERVRIDSSGRLLINTSSEIDTSTPAGSVHMVATGGGKIYMMRDSSSVAAGSDLGMLRFYSNDGGEEESVRIEAEADAAHSAGDKPGRLVFRTTPSGTSSPAERMRIGSDGKVGIGLASASSHDPNANNLVVGNGDGSNGITIRTSTTGEGMLAFADGGTGDAQRKNGFIAHDHSVNALRLGTGANERMRLDSSGRLLVGTTSSRSVRGLEAYVQVEGTSGPESSLSLTRNVDSVAQPYLLFAKTRGTSNGSNTVVQNGDALGTIEFAGADGTDATSRGALITCEVDGTPGSNDMPGRLVFSTTADGASTPTERMRIKNTGELNHFSTSGTSTVFSTSTTGTGNKILSGRSGGSSITSLGTEVFIVRTDGDVENTNNSYTSISDAKLKENIVDANSQWNDLKALQVRNYNFKEETNYSTHTQIGLVAQEVETVSPGLVKERNDIDDEGNDLGTTTKTVNYSVLYMKAVKALQEAMERIETLEAKVAALEAQ